MVWRSRASGAEAVNEVDGVALRVEAFHERVLLLDAQPVPPDMRHGSLGWENGEKKHIQTA